jgi:hypothetical protein
MIEFAPSVKHPYPNAADLAPAASTPDPILNDGDPIIPSPFVPMVNAVLSLFAHPTQFRIAVLTTLFCTGFVEDEDIAESTVMLGGISAIAFVAVHFVLSHAPAVVTAVEHL